MQIFAQSLWNIFGSHFDLSKVLVQLVNPILTKPAFIIKPVKNLTIYKINIIELLEFEFLFTLKLIGVNNMF